MHVNKMNNDGLVPETCLGITDAETKQLNIALRALGATIEVSAIRETSKLVVEVVADIQAGQINSLRSYNMEMADLKKVFDAFGDNEIEIYRPGQISPIHSTQSYGSHAIVSFDDALVAVTAQ